MRLEAHQWQFTMAEQGKSFLLTLPAYEPDQELERGIHVDIEIRALNGIDLFAVTHDGELLHLGSGSHVRFVADLVGFRSLAVDGDGTFSYRGSFAVSGRSEYVDPVPAVVDVELDQDDTLEDAVRDQLEIFMQRLVDNKLLKNVPDAEDIMEDLVEGDHEFEDEPDLEFGPQMTPLFMSFEDATAFEETSSANADPKPLPSASPAPAEPEQTENNKVDNEGPL